MLKVFCIIFWLVIVELLWIVIGSIVFVLLLWCVRCVCIDFIIIGFIILRWDGLNVSVKWILLLGVVKLDEKFVWYFMLFVFSELLCLFENLLNSIDGFLFNMLISMFKWLWWVMLIIIFLVFVVLVLVIKFFSIGISVLLFFREKCFVFGNLEFKYFFILLVVVRFLRIFSFLLWEILGFVWIDLIFCCN